MKINMTSAICNDVSSFRKYFFLQNATWIKSFGKIKVNEPTCVHVIFASRNDKPGVWISRQVVHQYNATSVASATSCAKYTKMDVPYRIQNNSDEILSSKA